MTSFIVKFQRTFEVLVDADTLEYAQQLARKMIAEFPEDTCKLLSIIPEGYVDPGKTVKPIVELTPEARAIVDRNEGLAKKVRSLTDDKEIA